MCGSRYAISAHLKLQWHSRQHRGWGSHASNMPRKVI